MQTYIPPDKSCVFATAYPRLNPASVGLNPFSGIIEHTNTIILSEILRLALRYLAVSGSVYVPCVMIILLDLLSLIVLKIFFLSAVVNSLLSFIQTSVNLHCSYNFSVFMNVGIKEVLWGIAVSLVPSQYESIVPPVAIKCIELCGKIGFRFECKQ